MLIDAATLKNCLPDAKLENVTAFVDPLNRFMEQYDITTNMRIAMFIAQTGHESGHLKYVKENLNYSAQGLLATFPKYFTPEQAQQYQRNPEAIANHVYANRMGNGPEESGDGWRFRGRGLIQITGRENYTKLLADLGQSEATYLETTDGAVESACWFWKTRNLNTVSDAGDVVKATKIINGGTKGLDERKHLYDNALRILG